MPAMKTSPPVELRDSGNTGDVGYFSLLVVVCAAACWLLGAVVQATLVILAVAWVVREVAGSIMNPTMRGDTVVITGAGSGIGRLMAHRFAAEGCLLVLWDLNADAVSKVRDECTALNATAISSVVDVSDHDAVSAAAKQAIDKFGRVDCLINNAGIVSGLKLQDVPPSLVRKTLEVNVHAHLWTTKAFLPGMLERQHGRVVTIASMAGILGVAGLADYCASKFGAVGFDEALRMELNHLGAKGVSTTCVCPYYIDTGMFSGAGCRWPFNYLFPMLNPDYVANRVIYATRRRQPQLCLPRAGYLVPVLRLLPVCVTDSMVQIMGVNASMDHFVQTRSSK